MATGPWQQPASCQGPSFHRGSDTRGPPLQSAPVTFGSPDDNRRWVRCANLVAERVASGQYSPGACISAGALSVELQMPSATVHNALRNVSDKGLITRVPGRGYFAPNAGQPELHAQIPLAKVARVAKATGSAEELLARKFITPREFATLLRVAPMTVYRLIHVGELTGIVKVGRGFRIPAESAEKYLNEHLIDGAQLDLAALELDNLDDA